MKNILCIIIFITLWLTASFTFGASQYYDIFNDSELSLEKWQPCPDCTIKDGMLWLTKQSAARWASNNCRMVSDNITNRLAATVSMSNDSFAVGNASVVVKLGGNYFNDTYSGLYNNWEGNIYADVRLQLTSKGYLYARAVVVRSNNNDGSSKTVLAERFPQTIKFNTKYTLSIELSGSSFIFKCNDESLVHQITTPIYPSNKLDRRLSAMVYANEGGSGYVTGSFDNVCIGEVCSHGVFLPAVFKLLL